MANPGETLGPYVVEALIAQGGMGAVYRACNRVTGQIRALKVVRPDLAKSPDFVDRFVREASIASQLRHPNLVETFEPGIDGETIYLPMELLEGETLGARLRRVHRFPPRDAAAIVQAVAGAAQLLHDRGLVHRDLKPMNVFLAREGGRETPKVIDLGTARDVEDDEHTGTGVVIGSTYYMALEQAEGRRDIDGRADQYALAVIAYQMITGTRPYESDDTRSAMAKLLRGDAYLLPSELVPDVVTPALEQVIVRGLAADRERRFPSILEFGAALAAAAADVSAAAVVDGDATSAGAGVAPSSTEIATRRVATRSSGRTTLARWLIAAALVSAVLVAGAAAWAVSPPVSVTVTELPTYDASARAASSAAPVVRPASAPASVDGSPSPTTALQASPPASQHGWPQPAAAQHDGSPPPAAAQDGSPLPAAAQDGSPPRAAVLEGSTPPSAASRSASARARAPERAQRSRAARARAPRARSPREPLPCGAATGIPCLE